MSRETFEFVAQLAREFPEAGAFTVAECAAYLIRYGRQHSNLAVALCNGEVDQEQYDKRKRRLRLKLKGAAVNLFDKAGIGEDVYARLAKVPDDFLILGGDPRGATVKLKLPSGRSNSFGGEGWCVPNS